MKRLLIPTDFSIQSLKAVQAAVDGIPGHQLCITLFHLLSAPVAITDLLLRPKNLTGLHLVTDEFKDACEVLKNKYSSRITEMKTDIVMGDTKAFLRNYLEGAQIDVIFMVTGTHLELPSKRSVHMLPLLRRTGWYMMEAPATTTPLRMQKTIMSDLLLTEN